MLNNRLFSMAAAMLRNGYHVLVNETQSRVTLVHRDGRAFSLLPHSARAVINNLRLFRIDAQGLPPYALQLAAVKPVIDQLRR